MSGLKLNNRFGNSFGNQSTKGTDDRPRAKYWMNIGYDSGVPIKDDNGQDTGDTVFISLPTGIALDTMEELSTAVRNAKMAGMRQAQNQLLSDILEQCETLEPGHTMLLGEAGGLQIQIRAVTEELSEESKEANPFLRTNLFKS